MHKPWDQFPTVQDPLLRNKSAPHRDVLSAQQTTAVPLSIVGAGLAGCWLARILAEKGVRVCLYEKNKQVALEASGNPAGIVKPFVTRSPSSGMAFHCLAHEFLLDRLAKFDLESACGFRRCGVLQLVHSKYPHSQYYSCLTEEASTRFAGISTNSSSLLFENGGWLNPNALCNALVQHPLITLQIGFELTGIEGSSDEKNHRLLFADKDSVCSYHTVFTVGSAIQFLPSIENIPLTPARGQLSYFEFKDSSNPLNCVVNGKHYAIPTEEGVYVGATFDREHTHTDVTEQDHLSNLNGLKHLLPDLKIREPAVKGYAALRATTPDRLPLLGPVPDFTLAREIYGDIRHGRSLDNYAPLPCQNGLYMLGGLGSRGIVTAPLCAHLLSNYLLGTIEEIPDSDGLNLGKATRENFGLNDWAPILNPARFLIRQLKRSQP